LIQDQVHRSAFRHDPEKAGVDTAVVDASGERTMVNLQLTHFRAGLTAPPARKRYGFAC